MFQADILLERIGMPLYYSSLRVHSTTPTFHYTYVPLHLHFTTPTFHYTYDPLQLHFTTLELTTFRFIQQLTLPHKILHVGGRYRPRQYRDAAL